MDAPDPRLTIVIPTRDRAEALQRAIGSALGQTLAGVEVVVVDDGSEPPASPGTDPRLRLVRLAVPSGVSAARNAGLEIARGRWVTFLDDDNVLLPDAGAVALAAIERSELPPPVAVVSGVEVVGRDGEVLDRRLPPAAHPRGDHYSLERLAEGRSHMTKQTLVAETELLRSLGGFDPSLPSRELADLLLRLNPVCSIEGVPEITYRLTRTGGPRLSRDRGGLEQGFARLLEKHRALFESHPRGYADALLGHARMSAVAGPRRAVVPAVLGALRVAPRHTLGVVLNPRRLRRVLTTWGSSG